GEVMGVGSGDALQDVRDRAILKLYLYTGVRLAAGCRLLVEDFSLHGPTPTLRLREKGDRVRTIGIHRSAAQAMQEYIEQAGLSSGPLFRPLGAVGRASGPTQPSANPNPSRPRLADKGLAPVS